MEINRSGGIAFEQGGQGDALLLLIHGLGATAAVWRPMLEQAPSRWPGRWIAPDLRGHGASEARSRYAIDDYASDLAALIAEAGGGPLTILGHSLGGVIALALAGDAGLNTQRLFGVGIKADWTDDELARMAQLSQRPPRLFDSEEEALTQHRRQCGLGGNSGAALLDRGVAEEGDKWRTAFDPAAFAIEPPPMTELTRASCCPVHLACGEHDAMITVERLRQFDPGARPFVGAGHNAMVDDPAALWEWMGCAS